MTISAAQIREARKLLRRSSAWLCKQSNVEFTVVLKAQNDADSSSVHPEDLCAIERVLTRAGVEFVKNSGGAGVRLRNSALTSSTSIAASVVKTICNHNLPMPCTIERVS